MVAVAKKRGLEEILSASAFYPDCTWLPPTFQLLEHVGDIAADNKISLSVYESLGISVKVSAPVLCGLRISPSSTCISGFRFFTSAYEEG
jgi:hypothetical protein